MSKKKANADLKRNSSGYFDFTSYDAIKKADKEIEAERHHRLIGAILRICELSGFTVESHIVLRDMRTGRVWK